MFNRFSKRNNKKPTNGRFAHGNEHLIDVRNVVKTFDTAAGKFTALKGVNMQVDPGEFVAVIGKSGSGKSTLINMLTGIDRPTSGEVLIGDMAVHTLNEGQMARWRGRNVGVVFQFFQLLPTLTVAENVMLPMDFCHMYTPRQRRERALDLLAQVELADQANKLPSAISGGQQQRAAIARALANDPPIIAADEPTGNLDSKTAESVFQMFERLVSQGKTILMVTHDQDLSKRAKRTIVLADGEIVDEYLAKALPGLNEEQLLRATHKLAPVHYAAGATILHSGEASDKFSVVTKGNVEVVLTRPDGQEIVVDHLSSGQFFGASSLMQGGKGNVTVRTAPNTPVEVVTLDREMFVGLLQESKMTKEEIERVIHERASNLQTVAGRLPMRFKARRSLSSDDLERLTDVFRRYADIQAVYLFGSMATGKTHAESDIDLAIVPRTATLRGRKLDIITDIGIAGFEAVSLVFLDTKDIALKFEAVRLNRVIYQTEDFDRGETYSRILREYWDFAPHLKVQYAAFKRRILNG